jgi:hypothetical protein
MPFHGFALNKLTDASSGIDGIDDQFCCRLH